MSDPVVQWNESIAIGVDYIDREHRNIIKLINTLNDIIEGDSELTCKELLGKIHEHVFTHFTHEEALMIEVGLPTHLFEEHITEHNRFRSTVVSYTLDVVEGKANPSKLLNYLVHWFHHHTSNIDIKMRPYTDRLPRK